jgi:hypothetical protein
MALHITDPAAEAAVRELAKRRGLSLTRAVEAAANEALARCEPPRSVDERLRELQDRIAAHPCRPDAFATHKEFFDWINDQE